MIVFVGLWLSLLLAFAPTAFAAPPANDLFVAAETLVGDTTGADGTLTDATKETGEPNHSSEYGATSVWYRWTATADRSVTIQLTGTDLSWRHPTLAVYTGLTVDGLQQVAAAGHGAMRVKFTAVAGQTYQVAVDRSHDPVSAFRLDLVASVPPANDSLAGAAVLSGATATATGTNVAATREAGEPSHTYDTSAGSTVWWTWTAPSTGGATLDFTGSGFRLGASVYTGDTVSGLIRVARTSYASKTQKLTFRAVAGTTYRIGVDGEYYSGPSEGSIALSLALTPPPDNDAFALAADLGSSATAAASGSTSGASAEDGEPQHYSYTGAKASAWYTWTAPSRGSLTIRADAGFQAVLAAYTGTTVSGLTRIVNQPQDYNGGAEQIRVRVEAGVTYRIAVDTTDAGRTGSFNLSLKLIGSPPNDDFADAETIVGPSVDVTGTNVGATQEPGEPVHDDNYYDPSVWYSWTAPATGGVTLDFDGSALEVIHSVYTGTSVGALTRVASTRSTSGTRTKRRFRAAAGVTYRIAVDGGRAQMGTFQFKLRTQLPPANDLFALATPLTGTSPSISGDTIGATGENGEPNPGGTAGASVWYSWTAPSNGVLKTAVTSTDFTASRAVYSGTSVDALTLLGSSRVDVEAGKTYAIAVHGGSAPQRGTFTLSLTHAAAPANDDFAAAAALSGTATGSTDAATRQTGEPQQCTCTYSPTGSVWFTWEAAESGPVRLNFTGSFYGATAAVYTGEALDALTTVVRSADYYSAQKVPFEAVAGTTYRIALAGAGGYTGSFQVAVNPVAAPANDQFANATELTGTSAEVTGSTDDATRESGEPVHCTYTSSSTGSIWYRWTAPLSGKVTLDYGTSFGGASGAVYTGDAVDQLTTVVKSYDYVGFQKKLTFDAIAGTTYRIAMAGTYSSTGTVNLKLDLQQPPANDAFAAAVDLDGTSDEHSGSTANGSAETGEPAHAGFIASRSVWHRWTAPATGPVTVDTDGSTFDTVLGVYTGASVGSLSQVASDDDSGTGTASALTFVATTGTTYAIAVDGKYSSSGLYTVSVEQPALPPEPPVEEQPAPPGPPEDEDPPTEGEQPPADPPTEGEQPPIDPPTDNEQPPSDPPADDEQPAPVGADTPPPAPAPAQTVVPTRTISPGNLTAPPSRPTVATPPKPKPTPAPLGVEAKVPSQRLAAILKRGLSGTATCTQACRIDVTVTFTVPGKRGRAAAAIRAKASSAGPRWTVKLTPAAKRRLRGARAAVAVITITARSGSETATAENTQTLRR